jgi:trigger factor
VVTNKEIKTLENSVVELTVTIEKDAVKKEYDELLKNYSKTAHMKGFRKGKVPTEVLERKFGEGLISESGFNMIEKSLEEVLKDADKKPLPYSQPSLKDEDDLKITLDSDLVFTVTYETYPEVKLGEYKGFEIEIPEVKIAAEDEKRELKKYQDQNALVTEKRGGKVTKDNVITINYAELDENDSVIEGTNREDFTFTVGTGYNYYKLDDDVIGMKKDEEKVIEKEFAEDFEYSELAGKKAKLKVTVTSVKSKKLPEIDDELAQDINEKFKTLDDLKKDIKERQEGMIESKLKAVKQEKLLEKIIENSEVNPPEAMINSELENQWNNFLYQFGGDENKVLEILTMQNKSKDDMLAEWRPFSEKTVKGQLLISKIGDEEKVESTDEELEEEIKAQSAQSGMSEEDFKKYIKQNNMTEYIRLSLKERKTYEMLLDNCKFKKGDKVKFLDFIQTNY